MIRTHNVFLAFHVFMLVMGLSMCETNITTDQNALLAFRAQLSLATNWSTHTSPCDWEGIGCDSTRHRRVTRIDLSRMNLTGKVPPELGRLSFLVSLNLSQNNFSDNLPSELANLRRLTSLDLSFNYFSGNLPGWFSFLPKLQYLNLKNNSFSGPLPSSLSNISTLEYISLSFNNLEGEIPREFGHFQSLRGLYLPGNRLTGLIPSSLLNISTLQVLVLAENELSGTLPLDMCDNHSELQGLYLSQNNIEGEIPKSLTKCSNLQELRLGYNRFRGQIPPEIGNLTKLEVLRLSGNILSGQIPNEIGNLNNMLKVIIEGNQITGSIPAGIFNNMTFLGILALGGNNLSGTLPTNICQHVPGLYYLLLPFNNFYGNIPSMLHNCTNLQALSLCCNSFTGTIPYGVFNISTLTAVDLTQNHGITGSLPPSFGYNLPNLEDLFLAQMNLSGTIPESISNASNLVEIDIGFNHFRGSIPASLGNLRYLTRLSVESNSFHYESTSEDDLSIIDFLTKFQYLYDLRISFNSFDNVMSSSIGNLSSSLQTFEAIGCGLKGNIPTQIGKLTNLVELDFSNNNLIGSIPQSLESLDQLQMLKLEHNNLKGIFPTCLCTLQNLGLISLSFNQISDRIPECLSNITSLRKINLDHNVLTFGVPPSFWDIKDLLDVNLSANSLNGSLSAEVVKLKDVVYLDLSNNQFSGRIPQTITSLQNLEILDLSNNKLQGSIPEYAEPTIALEFLNLSHNALTGAIPESMEKLRNLKYVNLSFNDLSGEIPSGGCFPNLTSRSFMFNEALCGSPRFGVPTCPSHRQHSSRNRRVLVFVFVSLGVLTSLFIVAFLWVRRHRMKNTINETRESLSFLSEPMRISYYELVQATTDFSQSNLLGSGSFGSVYKGVLSSGMVVAIKVFDRSEDAQRGFEVECQVLRNLRHRNLTKIITGCFGDNFKALVMEYMPNGSLEQWLHSEENMLDILQRLNVMIDVAHALEYLHHGYITPVIHCDLKPSNVLLDEDMVAHVCDFSVTKLLAGEEETFVHTKTLATLGYMAPEYGSQGRVSTPCDVYSYGILMMETFSRKKPTDDIFTEDVSISHWIRDALPQHPFQVIDASLLIETDKELDNKLQVASCLMELALQCAAESPEERPTMKDVVAKLNKIKFLL